MEESKNIYLMDRPIDDIKKDEFDHKSIVDEIVNNIQNNTPPYNIALIGKWGTGKSSILDCVENELEKEKGKYLFTKINAWKYEKQEIRKSFILEILDRLPKDTKKDKDIIFEIKELLNDVFQVNISKKNEKENFLIKCIKTIFKIFIDSLIMILPLLIMFIVSLVLIDIVLNIKQIQIPNYNGIRLDICGSFILAILGKMFSIIKDAIHTKKLININIKENIKDTNFYEQQMKKAIDLYKTKNKRFKTMICVVEDIDRLNTEKMVEAISALKSFVGIENIVFIVPYDTNILCKVLEECKINNLSNNYEILEGELILNKLFQFKVYMPELIQEDMYEYAKNLIGKDNSKIYSLFPSKEILLNEALPILMYDGVNTPREAKQLINSFIIKYNIAISRKIVEYKNLDSNDVKILSLLTVLENDFNEFYSKIIWYPTIIQDFIKIKDLSKIEGRLKEIYDELNDMYKAKKMQSLLMFLRYTTTIKTNNIERFIYLNDSKIDKVSGGKVGREFREALRNFEYKAAIKIIKNVDDVSNIAYREISYNNSNILKKKNIILTLIKIYNFVSKDIDKSDIRNLIESNIEIINKEECLNISIIELIKIILDDTEKRCKNIIKIFKEKLNSWIPVYIYFNEENTELIDEKNTLEEELRILINSYSNLDKECQKEINNLFNSIGDYSLTEEDIANDLRLYTFVDLYHFINPILNIENYPIFGENLLRKAILCAKKEGIKFEELKKLKDIYVKQNNFNSFTNELLMNFIEEKPEKILSCLYLINDNLNQASIDIKKMIFGLIEENIKGLKELDDIDILDDVLASIIIEILKEDENNDVDALLKNINEKIYIDKTVEIIAKNNLLEKVPNTILDINKELVGNSQDYYEMFEKIHNKYTVDAKKDLLNQLYKEIPNYKDNIDIIRKLFKILNNKNNKEICTNFIIEIIDYIKSKFSNFTDKNLRNELLKFSVDNTNFLEQNEKEVFFEFINEKVFTINSKLAVECSDNNNFNSINDIKWNEVISKYIDSTKLTINDFTNIIERHINMVTNDSELKNNYIEKVIDNFEAEKEILNILQKLKISEDETIINLYKVFLEYKENLDVLNCLKNIFENKEDLQILIEKIIQKDLDIKLLIEISNMSRKIDIEGIIKNIIEQYKSNSEIYSQKSKIKLLRIIADRFNGKKIFKNDFTVLATDILNNLDIAEIEDVVKVLISNKKIFDKESKKTLINKLEVTIEKMNEDDKNKVKKQLENF